MWNVRRLQAISVGGAALCLAAAAGPATAAPDALTGTWRATATVNGAQIPFRLHLESQGSEASGHFFDGPRATNPSKGGDWRDGQLHLVFPSYAATLDAHVEDGKLVGAYKIGERSTPIEAIRETKPVVAAPGAPRIAGEWIVPFKSPKGEAAWRLIIKQKGGKAEASILRIDGDTGTLDGVFDGAAFHLSHYAGERPAKLDVAVQPDHTLKLVLTDGSGARDLVGLREAAATAQGAAPTDPTKHTSVTDAAEPLAFSFPDLDGHPVSNTDPRFKGKVVVVDVMGSWCPNCHDEAPYLQALYRKYHAQGLEVVALDFEQPEQLANPQRLKAFIQRYGLTYTVLLAGDTKAVNAKLPQAKNLNAWPTTFFVGRDGLVKATHVGFTSPGSGPRDTETRAEVDHEVKTLLAGSAGR